MEQATTAGVQDSRKAEESRSDHLGEGKCTDKNAPKMHRKGSVGDNRVYTLRRWNAKKRIPVYTAVARENRTEFKVVLTAASSGANCASKVTWTEEMGETPSSGTRSPFRNPTRRSKS